MIACMFENFTDAALIDAMGEATRDEAAAIARRFALIGELDARRAREWQECNLWCTDPYEAVAAEISAAQNISRGRVGPGSLCARAARSAAAGGGCVRDRGDRRADGRDDHRAHRERRCGGHGAAGCGAGAALREVDAAVGPKLTDRVDLWVAMFDPAGVRVPPKVKDNRYVEVGETSPGMAGIWANIHAPDAAAFDKRLDSLAASVCEADPRTKDQRRADACGALGRGEERLACQCGSEDCPVAAERKALSDVVIHVLADQATLDGSSDHPGYLPGFGILPAGSVREFATTATLKPLVIPSGAPDPVYRPSAVTAEFVRWRDLTCRWPGCDAPVERCDVDHTVPYPFGPTHPSNNKLYCRTHYRMSP